MPPLSSANLVSPSKQPRLHRCKPKVERSVPDNQGGFIWTVTFTSDNQDGDLPDLTVESNDMTGVGATVAVTPVTEGSYLDGTVTVTFSDASGDFAADATAEDVRNVLEALGTGSLAVSREGAHLVVGGSNQHFVAFFLVSPLHGIALLSR